MKTEMFKGPSGLELFFRSWRPEGAVRGAVAIVHGFNSHGGYYSWVAEQLNASGFAAYAVDLRGRGQSAGERFFVERFTDYVGDVGALVGLARAREEGAPLFLLGHSAGGVISCLYALEHGQELAGLICESFAFRMPAPDIALAVLKGLSHVAPHIHVLKLENEHFSRDPKVLHKMNDDPLIAHEVQPTQTVAEMVRADELLQRSFSKLTLPLLILHGTADKATKPSGSQFFFETSGSRDKTLKLYEGHYHDLLNDIGKERVMADILEWLRGRLPAA
jgi:alpha-beta hydrolase superfamily lysophospholipase